MPFDNRPSDVRAQLRYRLKRRFRPAPHFRVQANGTEFVYCYIRKNACSAFKRLIIEHSEHRAEFSNAVGGFSFLQDYHRVRGRKAMSRYTNVIFVYRDPIQRIASLFRNKFIMMDRNGDIFRNYLEVTGNPPETATFDEFVTLYVCRNMKNLDLHCRPQHEHLLPIKYTDAIPMHNLYSEMARIAGEDIANSYFGDKTNSSGGREYDAPANNVPANVAYNEWQTTNSVPSFDSLLTRQTEDMLKRIYADDLSMIAEIEKQ